MRRTAAKHVAGNSRSGRPRHDSARHGPPLRTNGPAGGRKRRPGPTPGLTGDPPAIPIVAVEEQCKGWFARLGRTRDIHQQIAPYERLAELFDLLAEWDIISLGETAADLFAQLRRQKVRIGSQDLKIAAIALAEGASLLSANLRDFQKVPGPRAENWQRD